MSESPDDLAGRLDALASEMRATADKVETLAADHRVRGGLLPAIIALREQALGFVLKAERLREGTAS